MSSFAMAYINFQKFRRDKLSDKGVSEMSESLSRQKHEFFCLVRKFITPKLLQTFFLFRFTNLNWHANFFRMFYEYIKCLKAEVNASKFPSKSIKKIFLLKILMKFVLGQTFHQKMRSSLISVFLYLC